MLCSLLPGENVAMHCQIFQISGEAAIWILMWNLVLAQMLASFQIYLAEIQIVLCGTKIILKVELAQNSYRFVMGQVKPSISDNSVAFAMNLRSSVS